MGQENANTSGSGIEGAAQSAKDAAEKAQAAAHDAAGVARERASELAARAGAQAGAGMEKAAEGLGQASHQIRDRAQHQGGTPAQLGAQVADALDRTTEYLESHDSAEAVGRVRTFVKAHPVVSVAVAVLGVFVLLRFLK